MVDQLISIPGPQFLLYFALYSAGLIVLARFLMMRDYTSGFEVPEPTMVSPSEIAYLNEGSRGVVLTSVFNLWRNKAVEIDLHKKPYFIKQSGNGCPDPTQVEKLIYNFLEKPRLLRHLLKRNSLKTVEDVFAPNIDNLKQKRLLADQQIRKGRYLLLLVTFFLITVPGGLKLYFGIVRDKPFSYLILLLIALLAALFMVIKPEKERSSALGRKFLKKSKTRFEWLKTTTATENLLADQNLLYGIAVFGVAGFLGTSIGNLFEDQIELNKDAGSGYFMSSGCSGSGCSGCGGGGGCGGGCGGCGN